MAAACRSGFLLRNFANHSFGRQHQTGDRSRVLQGRAGHLRRIDDTRFDQIFVLVGLSVVAKMRIVVLADFAHHDRAFFARVLDDLTDRLFTGAPDDVNANLLVAGQLE